MRIIKQLNFPENTIFQDIKEQEITVNDLEDMAKLSGNFESLFSRRAKLYKEMGLKDVALSEKAYQQYILNHYTFLKRPVIIINDKIYVGNSQKTIKAAQLELEKL